VRVQHEGGDRWVVLAVALQTDADEGRFIDYSAHFVCQIDGLDEPASTYTLKNWESGILSGAYLAFRKQRKAPIRFLVSELRGRLRAEEMEVLALASTMAVSQLLGSEKSDCPIAGWTSKAEILGQAATVPS
jgi:hypothetical protein